MGIDIQLWRVRIGVFLQPSSWKGVECRGDVSTRYAEWPPGLDSLCRVTATLFIIELTLLAGYALSKVDTTKLVDFPAHEDSNIYMGYEKFVNFDQIHVTGVVVSEGLQGNFLNVFVPLLLAMSGDIELNPGPPKQTKQAKLTDCTSQRELRSNSTTNAIEQEVSFMHDISLTDIVREIRELKTDLKRQIDTSVHNVQDRVDELKEEVASMRNELKQNYQETVRLTEENKRLKDSLSSISRELDDVKGRLKRDNLLFHNIEQSNNETWEDSENKVRSFISEKLDLDGSNLEFDRVHRLTNARSRPQPIIAKFARFKQREQVLQRAREALKDTNFRISEDFSPMVRETRKKLGPFLQKARQEGKRAYLNFDKLKIDGTLYIFDESVNDIRVLRKNRDR